MYDIYKFKFNDKKKKVVSLSLFIINNEINN